MAGSDWTFKTARELRKALRAKKVSALELARDAIAQIEKHDAKINAICVRDFERGAEGGARAGPGDRKGRARVRSPAFRSR